MALVLRWALRSNLDRPGRFGGKPRDLGNAANHPEASPTNQERAAFVAGSQAWLDTNPDKQARAKFAAVEQVSAEALRLTHAFSVLAYKYKSPGADPDRHMQEAEDYHIAMVMQGFEDRRVTVLRELEEWGQAEPGDPLDVIRGINLLEEMARFENQLKVVLPPSARAELDEAGNAGSAGSPPAHSRGVSSKSLCKEEQADPKGVTGVCLENENSEIEPHPDEIPQTRDPVQEVKKEVRAEPNSFSAFLRGGKLSRSPSEV